VIKSSADQGTSDLLHGDDTKAARRFPKTLWRRIQQKLIILDTATTLKDLWALPGNRLKALRGTQRGRFSIRVNEQYRLTFRFEGGNGHEVRCEDCH
jgi:proteic killer suppression protein